MDGRSPPALRMRGISKRFGALEALAGVDFEVAAGEIHALLGENGAGKSTLMKILYGLLAPDAGEVEIDGRPVRFRGPRDARAAGIGMVHQHLMLVETLTVAENLALDAGPSRGFLYDRRCEEARARELSGRYGLALDPRRLVRELSLGERQRVEIVKALVSGARILVLDEPTAVLTPSETEQLLSSLRALAGEGRSVVFISHKLPEVLGLSGRVTVLRQGKAQGTLAAADTSPADLARRMIGRDVDELGEDRPGSGIDRSLGSRSISVGRASVPVQTAESERLFRESVRPEPAAQLPSRTAFETRPSHQAAPQAERVRDFQTDSEDPTGADARPTGMGRPIRPDVPAAAEVVLSAERLRIEDDRREPPEEGISFQVKAGEIVGVAGIEGNGQLELCQALAGTRRVRGGRLELRGVDIASLPPLERAILGLGLVPEDRNRDGVIAAMTLTENLSLKAHRRPELSRGPFARLGAWEERARRLVREHDVRPPDPRLPASALSGGNQQKLLLARELAEKPALLVAAGPTRGLDVGAAGALHRGLLAARAAGMAILLVSSDLDEILALSDRVLVAFRGRLKVAPRDPHAIGLMMGGVE